jgi:hypothetical protein
MWEWNDDSRYVFHQVVFALQFVLGWTTGRSRFDPRQRRMDFSSSLCVQTDSGTHPAYCTMGTGGPFLGAKARSESDTGHSPPSSAEVKK